MSEINAIICSRGKGGGCRAIHLPSREPEVIDMAGPPEDSAGEALPERARDAEGTHHPSSDIHSPAVPEPPASYWPPARTERSPALVRIPAGTEPERCTGVKCRARKEGPATIFKVKHPATGNITPAAVLDTITLPKDGAVVPTGAFGPYLDAAPGRETIMRDGMGYSHFIDCPDAPQFQRANR